MHFDWTQRAALERRMRSRTFVVASRLIGRAVVDATLAPLAEDRRPLGLGDADIAFAARCQGVAGRLRSLDAARPGDLSAALSTDLRDEAERLAARGRRLTAVLETVCRAAHARGLVAVPLKGTALRLTHYADPAHRPSADVDLLIAPADRARWVALLRDLGYTRVVADDRHTSFSRPGDVPAAAEGEHPDHPIPIELHERLVETLFGRTVDISAVYRDGLVEARAGDVPVRLPSGPAAALHLVHHAAAAMLDRGLRLAQLLDLQLIDASADTIARLGRELGPAAWAVAALAERDLPGLVPPALRDGLATSAPGAVRRAIVRRRPGILAGDPLRVRSLAGTLLLSGSPRLVARRVAIAVSSRSAYVDGELRPTTAGGAVLTFARTLLPGGRRRP